MTAWSLYVGTFTKEFQEEVDRLREESNDPWRGNALSGRNGALGQGRYAQGGEFSTGVEHFSFDDADGSLRHRETLHAGLGNPESIALHPTLPLLYAAEWTRSSRLATLAIHADGTLEHKADVPTLGELAIDVRVHPGGRHAYVVHWGDGALTDCLLDHDGAIESAVPVIKGDLRGVARRAHHHQVVITDAADALLVTDVGADELLAFRLDDDGTVDPEPSVRLSFPPNSGPRHLIPHPSGRFLYLLGEWDSMLYVVAAEGGMPKEIIGGMSTTPPDFPGKNKTGDIDIHPDGRTLYVANRDADCVTVYSLDDAGGVGLVGYVPLLGNGASALRVHPSGRYVLVGNQYSGSIEVFAIDSDAMLTRIGEPVEARAPRAFVFRQNLS